MPLCGIEAPAVTENDAAGGWRRRPAQPVIALIDSTNPPLCPARLKPAKSDTEALVRRRSGHDKVEPQSGRISALAGCEVSDWHRWCFCLVIMYVVTIYS